MVKGGHLKMSKMELDGAHKDKKSEHFKSDFTCEVFFKVTHNFPLSLLSLLACATNVHGCVARRAIAPVNCMNSGNGR